MNQDDRLHLELAKQYLSNALDALEEVTLPSNDIETKEDFWFAEAMDDAEGAYDAIARALKEEEF